MERLTTNLEGISKMYGIPLWTLRKWASQRKFSGIIRKGRRIYVDIEKFREWFYRDEINVDE